MKYLSLLICSFYISFIHADKPFETPRSYVVELEDSTTERRYPVVIKLPKSYLKQSEKAYPVILLTDAWYTFQVVSGATQFPMNAGRMEEAIIVAIGYANGSKGQQSRVRDYTPMYDKTWKLETGHAEQHAQFIRDVVLPYIDGKYRTLTSRRTFVGNSLGGLFGTYLLINYPQIFDHYVLGSPSIWFNHYSILNSSLTKLAKSLKTSSKKVYISVGQLETPEHQEHHDMVSAATKLAEKLSRLKSKNIHLKLKVIDEADHATAFPTTAIQGLYWLYKK